MCSLGKLCNLSFLAPPCSLMPVWEAAAWDWSQSPYFKSPENIGLGGPIFTHCWFERIVDLENDYSAYLEKQAALVGVGKKQRQTILLCETQRDPIETHQSYELDLHVTCPLSPLNDLFRKCMGWRQGQDNCGRNPWATPQGGKVANRAAPGITLPSVNHTFYLCYMASFLINLVLEQGAGNFFFFALFWQTLKG